MRWAQRSLTAPVLPSYGPLLFLLLFCSGSGLAPWPVSCDWAGLAVCASVRPVVTLACWQERLWAELQCLLGGSSLMLSGRDRQDCYGETEREHLWSRGSLWPAGWRYQSLKPHVPMLPRVIMTLKRVGLAIPGIGHTSSNGYCWLMGTSVMHTLCGDHRLLPSHPHH